MSSEWSKYLANGVPVAPGGKVFWKFGSLHADLLQKRFPSVKTFVISPISKSTFTSKVSRNFNLSPQKTHYHTSKLRVCEERLSSSSLTQKVYMDVHIRTGLNLRKNGSKKFQPTMRRGFVLIPQSCSLPGIVLTWHCLRSVGFPILRTI